MKLRRRRFVAGITPGLDLQALEFDDHPRLLVKLAAHTPVGILDRTAPRGVDVECSCGRALYLGHMVAHIVRWIREARLEVIDRLLHRIGQADVVATFGRDQVETTLTIIRAVTQHDDQPTGRPS